LLATAKPVENPPRYGSFGGLGANAERPRALFVFAEGGHPLVVSLEADGSHRRLGTLPIEPRTEGDVCLPTASQDWLGVVEGNEVSIVGIGDDGLTERLPLGRHEGDLVQNCMADPLGRSLLTWTESGEIRLWDVAGRRQPRDFEGPQGIQTIRFSRDGSYLWATAPSDEEDLSDVWIWSVGDDSLRLRRRLNRIDFSLPAIDPVRRQLAMRGPGDNSTHLWSLDWPAGSEPVVLRRGETINTYWPAMSPDGNWLATCDGNGLALWPLSRQYPTAIKGGGVFGPEGRFLAMIGEEKIVLSSLEGPIPEAGHTVFEFGQMIWNVAVSPDGEYFAACGAHKIVVGRDDGEQPMILASAREAQFLDLTFSSDSRLVAVKEGVSDPSKSVYRVWEVSTGREVGVLDLPEYSFNLGSSFTSDGRLLIATSKGVVAWDVTTGDHEVLAEIDAGILAASEDGRRLLVLEMGEGGMSQEAAGSPVFFDLNAGTTARLDTHGERPWNIALSQNGAVAVTAGVDGFVRVGPTTGEDPHLLVGGRSTVVNPAFDPLGRWIVSGNGLLPMPDLSKPPLHTLPRAELIAKLETLTNIRVVRDPESATGWTLTHEPFQGWETVPSW
jgi:WD40 repeat protein